VRIPVCRMLKMFTRLGSTKALVVSVVLARRENWCPCNIIVRNKCTGVGLRTFDRCTSSSSEC
jgi:hypothetical protein